MERIGWMDGGNWGSGKMLHNIGLRDETGGLEAAYGVMTESGQMRIDMLSLFFGRAIRVMNMKIEE